MRYISDCGAFVASRSVRLYACTTAVVEQEDLGADEEGGGISTVPQAGYLELKDSAGHAEMAVVSAEEVRSMRMSNRPDSFRPPLTPLLYFAVHAITGGTIVVHIDSNT